MPVRAYARVLVALTASIATATVANADTLHVPSQYATIQAAIDGAQPGDEVVVADGVYTGAGSNTNLDLSGKAITVRSASADPASSFGRNRRRTIARVALDPAFGYGGGRRIVLGFNGKRPA